MIKMKPVSNPMLVGALELLKAENTPEHRKLVMEEVVHAKFLAPVMVDPAPVLNENGVSTIAPNSKINMPMLSTPDGKHFFMAFTDVSELQKWKKEENQQVFAFDFKHYLNMLATENSASDGIVINPFGHNLLLPRTMLEGMMPKKPVQE